MRGVAGSLLAPGPPSLPPSFPPSSPPRKHQAAHGARGLFKFVPVPCRYGGEVFSRLASSSLRFLEAPSSFSEAGHSCASSPVERARGSGSSLAVSPCWCAGRGAWHPWRGVFFFVVSHRVCCEFVVFTQLPSALCLARSLPFQFLMAGVATRLSFEVSPLCVRTRGMFSAFCPWSFEHASFSLLLWLGGPWCFFFVLRQCQPSHSEVWWRSQSISWSGG